MVVKTPGAASKHSDIAATLKSVGISNYNFSSAERSRCGNMEMNFGRRNKKDLRWLAIDGNRRAGDCGWESAVGLPLGLHGLKSERAAEGDGNTVGSDGFD